MAAKFRDWTVTVYPIKYATATEEDIATAEDGWLHEQEHGPFGLQDKIVYMYGCMERGAKGSKLHCHYRVYFANQVRIASLQKIFGKNIKAAVCQNPDAYEEYIRKEGKFVDKADTHIAGPWSMGEKPIQGKRKSSWAEIRDMIINDHASNAQIIAVHPFAAVHSKALEVIRQAFPAPNAIPPEPFLHPFPYQKKVIDLVATPPVPRQWIWVWSKEKGVGKSQLGQYILMHGPGVLGSKDRRSVLYAYDPGVHRAIVFDLPLYSDLTDEFLMFLEELSDHKYLMSDKYQPIQKFVRAHIVVLTNHAPPVEKWGHRLHIVEAVKPIQIVVPGEQQAL